jgi:hypothetical protein
MQDQYCDYDICKLRGRGVPCSRTRRVERFALRRPSLPVVHVDYGGLHTNLSDVEF